MSSLRVSVLALTLLISCHVALASESASGGEGEIHFVPPFWACLPFVGCLLSVAFVPLFFPHLWEHHFHHFSLGWLGLGLFFQFVSVVGTGVNWAEAYSEHFFSTIEEYVAFIILLGSLYIISGGFYVSGKGLKGTPFFNTMVLVAGGIFASLIGTTGAAMILIRPLLVANRPRKHKSHTVIAFVFVVCNIGGCLTPIGDPPLFLGFLQGVPFFWTIKLFPAWALALGVVIALYYGVDRYYWNKENKYCFDTPAQQPAQPKAAVEFAPLALSGGQTTSASASSSSTPSAASTTAPVSQSASLLGATAAATSDNVVSVSISPSVSLTSISSSPAPTTGSQSATPVPVQSSVVVPVHEEGHNAVAEHVAHHDKVLEQAHGGTHTGAVTLGSAHALHIGGFSLYGVLNLWLLLGVVLVVIASGSTGLPESYLFLPNIARDLLQLWLAYLSLKTTPKEVREANNFTFGPIKEVAWLFSGIFMCMIPAIMLLIAKGKDLGVTLPIEYFYITGSFSAFLDNAPTYVTFMSAALGLNGMTSPTELIAAGGIAEMTLKAVSLGSVFFGALTYIGNGPNFMVKSIAESAKVEMPTFFGYMLIACIVLLPTFTVVGCLFLL